MPGKRTDNAQNWLLTGPAWVAGFNPATTLS